VDISNVYEQKVYAMSAHESQYFEWLPWVDGQLDQVPADKDKRLEWLAAQRKPSMTQEKKECLAKWVGEEKASQATMGEAFEICEYGKKPTEAEIRELFYGEEKGKD
jgi:hypothetical protein